MGVHGPTVSVVVGVPDRVQDLLAGADGVGRLGQEEQQVVFLRRQGERLAVGKDLVGGQVDLKPAEAQDLAGTGAGSGRAP